jgi:small conductance mechanosensitive channel
MEIQKILEHMFLWMSGFGLKLLAAVAILVFGRIAVNLIRKFILRVMRRRKIEEAITTFTASLTYTLLWTFVILSALASLGVETTSFMTVIGAAGLAIGLALQGSLSNFAAGFLLIILRPFKVGDFVEASGVTGSINKISIFTTEFLTPDNKREIVPNSSIMNGIIINYTAEDKRRIDLTIGVGYESDLLQVKEVIKSVLEKHDYVLKDPEPLVRLGKMNDSSLDFVVRAWVQTQDYWDVYFDLNEGIKLALDKAKINIPFPQMDVHLIKKD